MIRAIETRYKGYRFRSRLEARWAVFFDALGIHWEYEKEGYELLSGRYLPDFWLPEWRVFVEIKGEAATEQEWKCCDELSAETGSAVYLAVGMPYGNPDLSVLFCWDSTDSSGGSGQFNATVSSNRFIVLGGFRERTVFTQADWTSKDRAANVHDVTHPDFVGYIYSQEFRSVERAVLAAKSARFEHGESGSR